jgi:hypothetical protein
VFRNRLETLKNSRQTQGAEMTHDEMIEKLAHQTSVLQRIAEYDHQRTASDALKYFLKPRNEDALREALVAIASTDIQSWAKDALKGETE